MLGSHGLGLGGSYPGRGPGRTREGAIFFGRLPRSWGGGRGCVPAVLGPARVRGVIPPPAQDSKGQISGALPRAGRCRAPDSQGFVPGVGGVRGAHRAGAGGHLPSKALQTGEGGRSQRRVPPGGPPSSTPASFGASDIYPLESRGGPAPPGAGRGTACYFFNPLCWGPFPGPRGAGRGGSPPRRRIVLRA